MASIKFQTPLQKEPLAGVEKNLSGEMFSSWWKKSWPPLVAIGIIVGIWQIISNYLTTGLEEGTFAYRQQQSILPAPAKVGQAMFNNFAVFLDAGRVTLTNAFTGFLIGAVVGFGLALLMDQARWVERSFYVYIVASQMIPVIALAPILYGIIKEETLLKITVSAYLTFFPVTVNVLKGLRNVNPSALDLMHSYAAGIPRVYHKLKIPSTMPFLFNALKIASTGSLIGAIVAELMGGNEGIGVLIVKLQYTSYAASDKLWALIFEAAIIGLLFFLAISLLERVVVFVAARISKRQKLMALVENKKPGEFQRAAWKKFPVIIPPLLVALIFILLWQFEVIHALLNIKTFQLPVPTQIIESAGRRSRDLWLGTTYTLVEAVVGLAIGSTTGFFMALFFVWFDLLRRGIMPLAVTTNAIPIIAFVPIVSRWFGFDQPTRIVVVAMMTFAPMVVSAYKGLTSLDNNSADLMHTLAASRAQVFLKLRLPSSMTYVFNALKVGTTAAMIGSVVAEFFNSAGGIGKLIANNIQSGDFALAWCGVVIVTLVGLALYFLVGLAERIFVPWQAVFREKL